MDLTDAYHHVGIHPDDRHFFTFALDIGGGEVQYISCSALNFGWSWSPYVFTAVMRPVVTYLRAPGAGARPQFGELRPAPTERGVRALPWLDDFLFLSDGDEDEARRQRDSTWRTFSDLGLQRAVGKGQADPTQFIGEHLGYGVDTVRGLFLLTPQRVRRLCAGAADLVCRAARHQGRVHAKRLASFVGLAQASSLAIPLARAWLRSLHDDLASRRSWRGEVRLSRQSFSDLRQWMRLRSSRHVGRSIWREPETRTLHADAGPYGWGAQLDHSRAEVPAAGFWQPWEAAIHITWRELRAVRLAVEFWCEQLRGHSVLLHEDNAAVVAILTTLTSRSALLMREVRALLAVLDQFDVQLRAVWIASAANAVADHFSRLARPLDYSPES